MICLLPCAVAIVEMWPETPDTRGFEVGERMGGQYFKQAPEQELFLFVIFCCMRILLLKYGSGRGKKAQVIQGIYDSW